SAALAGLVCACGGGAGAPPGAADVDRAAQGLERAVREQDARLALACDLDDVEESSWTTEEAAVVSPTLDDAMAHVLQDEIWSSFGLPDGRRDAVVEHAVQIGHGTFVPVLVDRSLRVLLAVEPHDDGFTIAGALMCR
ncbi:MAG: hypothetical protein ACLGHQ_13715, partial [Acidimicrobiia bacterium]